MKSVPIVVVNADPLVITQSPTAVITKKCDDHCTGPCCVSYSEEGSRREAGSPPSPYTYVTTHRYKALLRGGLAVGRWTCDLQVAGSIPDRSAFT